MSTLDLDAYFERIGWTGGTRPNLDTLAGLLDRHMLHVPFENLDILLGRGIRLDLEHLQNKMVKGGRGGYCFEHATLFGAVLERLGFRPAFHSARVTLLLSRSSAPRTHAFLSVELAGTRYVIDPGFGLLAPRTPIALVDGADSLGERDTHWMVRDGGHWLLRARRRDKSADAWASTLERDNPMDLEVGNHFTASHPASPFVNRLMLRAVTPDGYVSVMNRDVTRWRDGSGESSRLEDRGALRALLREHFGFDLPEIECLRVPGIPEWS